MGPVFFHPAARTGIGPVGQSHLLPVTAGGAVLGRIGRVDLPELPTGAFSLVREQGEELRPRHIADASVQASVGVHFVDMDVLHEDSSGRCTIFVDSLVPENGCKATGALPVVGSGEFLSSGSDTADT